MCLLITGASNSIREQLLQTPGLIGDIYNKNGDGLGIMYGTESGLHTYKCLPANANDFKQVIELLPNDDRDVAIHARWRTHGDIDLDNCHPYQVNDTTALMHNGILSTGNTADESKSDTWHFIKDYLSTVPDDVLHHAGFREMLGDFIGNNKFAIMSADGRLSVINKDQGISHDGVWYSNTYAWTPRLLIPGHGSFGKSRRAKWTSNYGGFGGHLGANANAYGLWDDEDEVETRMLGNAGAGAGSAKASAEVSEASDEPCLEFNVEQALYNYDSSSLAMCLEQEFNATIDFIFNTYIIDKYIRYRPEDYAVGYIAAVEGWTKYDADILRSIDPTIAAEALIQCCEWDDGIEDEREAALSAVAKAIDAQREATETPAAPPTLTLVQ